VVRVRRSWLIMMVALLACAAFLFAAEGSRTSLSNIRMLQGDLFLLALSPPVQNIQVHVKTTGGGYSYLVLTNRTLGIPDVPGRASLVQLVPEDPLTNITVVFSSNTTVRVLYGVLTNNYTYYKQVSTNYYTFSNGIFIVLPPRMELPPGDSSMTFIISVVSMEETESGFRIELPPLATAIPVVVAIIFLIYLNAYAIVDSYYVSTKEELSRARKFGLALLLLLSAIVIYWLAGFILRF
jgi:hypothetical protein